LSETRTEKKVTSAAIKSKAECAASDKIPSDPVLIPTTTLRVVTTSDAMTEFPATARFSLRIDPLSKGARTSGISAIIAADRFDANPFGVAWRASWHATMKSSQYFCGLNHT
jgi:hypothetical protein